MTDYRSAPFRDAEFMPVDLSIERRDDGTVVLGTKVPMPDADTNIPRAFAKRANAQPDTIALAERADDGGWSTIDYGTLKVKADAAAQWMIDNLPPERPVMVLAENSIASAIFTFASYAAGLVHMPVSPGFGMVGGDYTRLAHVIDKAGPGFIYADGTEAFAKALATVAPDDAIIASAAPEVFAKAINLQDILATKPTAAVDASIEGLDTARVASYMMTSGSTGLPKVVQLSLDALSANAVQTVAVIGQAAGWDEVMLDWLPWHHAAGASVLRTTLLEGGSLYIDAGKPAPGLFQTSIDNLREISVSYFNNVPAGYAILVGAMEQDFKLRRSFFAKMRLMLYGGAGLPQEVFDRLQTQAVEETGHRIHMTTGYGMTETTSGCMAIHFPTDKVGIGLPCPGLETKLVPYDDRYEVRLRGPNLMAGYLGEPEKNAEAFDEEGFYRTGDLARLHDPEHPEEGLAFAGRMAEEFKLSSGAWVYGGELKAALLKALSPFAAELVLCDDNRPFLGVLAWPRPDAGEDVLDRMAERLTAFNENASGSSSRIRRVGLLDMPPDPAARELSDKGTINRRAVLDNRQADVERLYADEPGAGIRKL